MSLAINWMEIAGPFIGLAIAVVLQRFGIKLPGTGGSSPPVPVKPTPDAPATPFLDSLRALLETLKKRRTEDEAIRKELEGLTKSS